MFVTKGVIDVIEEKREILATRSLIVVQILRTVPLEPLTSASVISSPALIGTAGRPFLPPLI
jgi:hypothetical protein